MNTISKLLYLLAFWTKKKTIIHIGLFFTQGNAGDNLMRTLVKRFLGFQRKQFIEMNVRTEVTKSQLNVINKSSAVVIGGGGFFWANPRLNFPSGWQWNISNENIRGIEIPIILFAIGNSTFPGETLTDKKFISSVNCLLDKGALLGFRNKGSYLSLKPYFDSRFEKQSFYQPCPTTFIQHLSFPFFKRTFNPVRPVLAVNLPFDKADLRYPSSGIIDDLVSTVKILSERYRVICASHIESDLDFESMLKSSSEKIETVHLFGKSSSQIIDFYSSVDLVVGGRGHSVMVPLGLGKPIIGVSSHSKISWFFEDLDESFSCIKVNNKNLSEDIISSVEDVVLNYDEYQSKAKKMSKKMYLISMENRKHLNRVIKGKCRNLDVAGLLHSF